MTNIRQAEGCSQQKTRKRFGNVLTTGAVSSTAIGAETGARSSRNGSKSGGRGNSQAGGKTPSVASSGGCCKGSGAVPLDTLALPDQTQRVFQKRGRAKFVSLPLATALAELHSPLEKSYRNTIYCASCIKQENGVLSSKYCGNRWCLVCSRIRTARAMNAYLPVLSSWSDPYLVTLTVPNCSGEELPGALALMQEKFTSCKRSIVRTHGLELIAVRKLECTYNNRRGDFHPHYHVIVNGQAQAELLRGLWLRRWQGVADAKAQDVRKCDENALGELFKYFTKLTTRTGAKGGGRGFVPVAALDVIFRAMRHKRVWQPVGFQLPKEVEESIEGEEIEVDGTVAFKRATEVIYWEWFQTLNDWVDRESGETLSDYEPGERFRRFVGSIEAGPELVPVYSDA